MEKFQIFAQPWWVNSLVVVPFAIYFSCRRKALEFDWRQKLALTAFSLAFGFLEAAVVVYLRAAVGLLPGYASGSLADIQRLSATYQQTKSMVQFPHSLLTIEVLREAATMVMLIAIAFLGGTRKPARERWAAFLWAFAVWDITYYAGLWAMVRWPSSLKSVDVLFLIPAPWVAQVWYPILVSALTLIAISSLKTAVVEPASNKSLDRQRAQAS